MHNRLLICLQLRLTTEAYNRGLQPRLTTDMQNAVTSFGYLDNSANLGALSDNAADEDNANKAGHRPPRSD